MICRFITPLFLAAFLFAPFNALAEINYLSTEQARRLPRINEDDWTLLDVRTPDEYAEGHIPGAINADCLKNDFRKKLESLPKDRPLLMYCRSGQRTKKASKIAEDAGFKNIYVLEKGFEDWRKVGMPVEK
ncbi:MAG: rhodanese-like domain-containing protein [Desulfovibrio sp.]|nr:rhodanese-like domain-containing protein [Desulfovibrio sp.]